MILFVTAYVLWLLLNMQNIVAGAFIALLVTFLSGHLFVVRPHILKHPSRWFYFFLYYVPLFLWECLKANIDVAYRVIHPSLPINPGIVKVRTRLKSDVGLTFLANSITLTPGTLTVDIDRDGGCLYIHWIDVKSKDTEEATKIIVGHFESILMKIFE